MSHIDEVIDSDTLVSHPKDIADISTVYYDAMPQFRQPIPIEM